MAKQSTLTEYLTSQLGEYSPLRQLIDNLATACQGINSLIQRGELDQIGQVTEYINVQGEEQKQLDILSNELVEQAIASVPEVAAYISEEVEPLVALKEQAMEGDLLVAFDPLDGSSNSDLNITVGSIFAIFKLNETASVKDLIHNLPNADKLVCSAYVLYGPSLILVLSIGDGVVEFTYDNQTSAFRISRERMRVKPEAKEFAINMSNYRRWQHPVRQYVDECLAGKEGVRNKDFNMRWVASMVAEVHRILVRGGIYLYPYDERFKPGQGRLRLLYECLPLGWMVEQAGGRVSTGTQPLLKVNCESIHQRIPVMLGSREEVERVERYHQL